jgi:protein tyrosine/serine phosphatase
MPHLHRSSLFLILVSLVLLICGCSPTVYNHGVPNLVQVDPGLWRSGQPTTVAQWQYLKSLGITQVVKLNFESEGSDSGAIAVGMSVKYLSIQPEGGVPLEDIANTFVRPDPERLLEAEQTIEAGGGVLVHCTHGQDRTGLVIGRYRVLHNHWTKDAAYAEMLRNNFHPALHGLHESWEEFHP